jgi:RimJ/RimL family protein N-acetyltransferase
MKTKPQTRLEMTFAQAQNLDGHGLRLVPLALAHELGLKTAAADGELWKLRVTSVPEPHETLAYIQTALQTPNRAAFAVLDEASGKLLGTSSYHDILPDVRRLEIGFTWYAASIQRTHVNTCAKILLMTHAFEVLHCNVVGWRTDNFNFASQRAIERLGAQKDGVLRGHALRRDGTIKDTVMYSMRAGEWPEAKAQLLSLLDKTRTN